MFAKLKENKPEVFKAVRYTLRGGLALFILGILALIIFVFAVLGGRYGELPTRAELKSIQNPIASEVYSEDGVLLGRYYLENRSNVTYAEIPQDFKDALIATEDARFFKHGGVDRRAMARVMFKSVLLQDDSAGGGSTISQQLAKNLFNRKNYGRLSMPANKLKEMITAKRIEDTYNKEEVLTLYLNTVSFGEDVFGLKMAARRFFDSSLDDLTLDQQAILVGMLKAPTKYSPRINPDLSRDRRNTVLQQMYKYKYITKAQRDEMKRLPMRTKYNFISHSDGAAPYFRESLKQELKEWCKQHKKADGTPYNIYTDGLKIYTSINSKMQTYAEEAVRTHMEKLQEDFFNHWKGADPFGGDMKKINIAKKRSNRYLTLKEQGKSTAYIDADFRKARKMNVFSIDGEKEVTMSPIDSIAYYQKFLQVGFMAMEPQTGYIRAYVGGINHENFKLDHTRTKRQVGSTFKPIVYAAALDSAASPCTFMPNRLFTYPEYQDWTPRNSDDKYGGQYSMKGALQTSTNTVTVQWMMRTGVYHTVDLAREMGIESDIPETPAIALGAADISLYEMMQVYGTFANSGKHVPPAYLLRIEDRRGKTIEKFKTNIYKRKQVIDPEDALIMLEMMQTVIDSGTGRRLRWRYELPNDIAGKTGTTQNHTDGWFMGITPKLVGGVWVGGDDRRVRFRTINYGQGANLALPVWGEFFKRVNADAEFADIRDAKFAEPPQHVTDLLNCPGYLPYDYIDPAIAIEEVIQTPQVPVVIKPEWDKSRTNTAPSKDRPKIRKPIIPRPPKITSRSKRPKKKKERKGLFNGFFKNKKKKRRNRN